MSRDIEPKKEHFERNRKAINTQLEAVYSEKSSYTMDDFVENYVQVITYLQADVSRLQNIIKGK